jgi:hypothetical protein
MIKIHFDFTDGTELSYSESISTIVESINNGTSDFATHSLEVIDQWLAFDRPPSEIVVLRKDGSYIDIKEVLKNDGNYGDKYLTRDHSLARMIKANALRWQPPKENEGMVIKGQAVAVSTGSVLNDIALQLTEENLN